MTLTFDGTTLSIVLHAILWVIGWMLLWRVRHGHATSVGGSSIRTSVIVPARNEEHRIGPLLVSLQHQTVSNIEVLIVDDHSTDRTAEIARKAGFTVFSSDALPSGWMGKPWACWQGAQKASGQIFLFIDADVSLEKMALSTLLAEHDRRGGVISVLPYHEPKSWVEQLSSMFNIIQLISCGAFTWNAPRQGPFRPFGPIMLCSRNDYFHSGGHEAVKDKVVENFALSKEFEKKRIPVHCFPGHSIASYRMYADGFRSLYDGWTKSFAQGAKGTSIPLLIGIVAWLTGSIGTARHLMLACIDGNLGLTGFLGAIYMLYVGQIIWMLKHVGRFRFLTALFYPISALFFVWVFLRSIFLPLFKKIQWKGRSIST